MVHFKTIIEDDRVREISVAIESDIKGLCYTNAAALLRQNGRVSKQYTVDILNDLPLLCQKMGALYFKFLKTHVSFLSVSEHLALGSAEAEYEDLDMMSF